MRSAERFKGTCSTTVIWPQVERMRMDLDRMLDGYGILHGEITGRGHKRISDLGMEGITGCERVNRQHW